MTKPDARESSLQRPNQTLEAAIAAGTRALVVGPYRARESAPRRSPEARLEEATGLARAIDLQVARSLTMPLSSVRPATYIGKGKVEELAGLVANEAIDLVIMDCALSPVQQRNLEKALGAKVIDRACLILEIFGRRARTREGSLQVELAHLIYQKSRLVRSWTHLERQRGGFGFLGGPGETQIEADRRVIWERMARIERELEGVKRTRALHRASRRKTPYPIVALVGYTNAGKSTLFNRLTDADVVARDMLFATLDPTARALRLPHGGPAILSDTVGFISDLPTMLIAAFRATLEDVISADIILHVRDLSHGDTQAQAADVDVILRDLGVDPADHARLIEVWNKIDLLAEPERDRLAAQVALRPRHERPVIVSAVTGEGLDILKAVIEQRLAREKPVFQVRLASDDGAGLHWLHEETEVLERRADASGRPIVVLRVAAEKEGRLLRRFPQATRLWSGKPLTQAPAASWAVDAVRQ